MPVAGVQIAEGGGDEDQNGSNLDRDHEVVGFGRLAYAAHEDDGEQQNDEEGWDVESEVPARVVDGVALQVCKAVGEVGRGDPFCGWVQAEPVEEVNDVGGKANADGHVGAGVFENQVPADDPGDELAE